MSLHYDLNKMIWDKGYLSLDEIEAYCKRISTDKKRYKLSNAERRLRPSESPHILPVEQNGAIIGYEPNRNFPPPEEKEKPIVYHPLKLKRKTNPFMVAQKINEINKIPMFKEKVGGVKQGVGLFN